MDGRATAVVLTAGALIAVAILIAYHWQLAPLSGGAALRLDRWTGAVALCAIREGTTPAAGTELSCTPAPPQTQDLGSTNVQFAPPANK
jgi:hypothetical protein